MATVLYVVTEDWYFSNHRRDHALALMEAGFDVAVACRTAEATEQLESDGITVVPLSLDRSLSPQHLAREAKDLYRIIRQVKPDVVHAVALKPIGLCLMVMALCRKIGFIFAVSGLGVSSLESSTSLDSLAFALRAASRLKRVRLLFQNDEDRARVAGNEAHVRLVPGVGVDIGRFAMTPSKAARPLKVIYLGRAVKSKGLLDIASVAERFGPDDFRFELYLHLDPASPNALSDGEVATLTKTPSIDVRPPTADAPAALAEADLAILASHGGEGVSKFVLEALACGRPIVASRSPGSSAVINTPDIGKTFEPGNLDELESALRWFLRPETDLHAMQYAAREVAERRFSLAVLLPAILEIHSSLLAPGQ